MYDEKKLNDLKKFAHFLLFCGAIMFFGEFIVVMIGKGVEDYQELKNITKNIFNIQYIGLTWLIFGLYIKTKLIKSKGEKSNDV